MFQTLYWISAVLVPFCILGYVNNKNMSNTMKAFLVLVTFVWMVFFGLIVFGGFLWI